MEYKIKCKLVNDYSKYGIIDEKLKTVVEFNYDRIDFDEKSKVYILKRASKPDKIFFAGKILPKLDDFYDLTPISNRCSNYWLFFIAKRKNEKGNYEVGIIAINYNRENVDVIYPFGKVDRIEIENNSVYLYKDYKTKTDKGIWRDKDLGTLKPIYKNFSCIKKSLDEYPRLEKFSKDHDWYFPTNGGYGDYFTREFMLLFYSKKINGRVKKGIKALAEDTTANTYDLSYSFQDIAFVKESDDIIWDMDNRLFILKNKTEKGDEIKLVPYSYKWQIYTKGACVYGRPTIEGMININESLKNYEIINSNFIKVQSLENEKWGVLDVRYPYSFYGNRGPRNYSLCIDFIYDKPEDIELIQFGEFMNSKDGKKHLEYFHKTSIYDNSSFKPEEKIVTDEYEDIKKLYENIFILTISDNQKIIGSFKYDVEKRKECFNKSKKAYKCFDVSTTEFRRFPNYIKAYIDNGDEKMDKFDILNERTFEIIVSNIEYTKLFDKYLLAASNEMIFIIDKNLQIVFEIKNNGVSNITYNEDLDIFTYMNGEDTISIKHGNEEEAGDLAGDYKNIINHVYNPKNNEYIFEIIEIPNDGFENHKLYGANKKNITKICELNVPEIIDDSIFSIVADNSRTIVNSWNKDENRLTKGVIENKAGNICIPNEYDDIEYIDEKEIFVCKKGENEFLFDKDGFYIPEVEIKGKSKKLV